MSKWAVNPPDAGLYYDMLMRHGEYSEEAENVNRAIDNKPIKQPTIAVRADMIDDPKFLTNEDRVKNRLEVDEAVGGWIGTRTLEECMEVFERENLFERAAQMSPTVLDAVFSLEDVPVVSNIRGYGMLAGIDLRPTTQVGQRGHEVQKQLFEAGVHVKATGDTLLVAPPFVIEAEQVAEMTSILRSVLSAQDV